jgi:chorismate dehydratase
VNKIRVSAVSYTNTKPFVYGLQHSGILDRIDLSLDIPSDCAAKVINDEADLGLIPVAALLSIPNYQIISDFCIGADGAVDSVFLFSDKPVTELRTVRLDTHSRTSNGLARVLLKYHWQVEPVYVGPGDESDAFVEIGDRTFGKKNKFPFVYDLAEQWKAYCGLPFVFAAWTANKPLDPEFRGAFSRALAYGVDHMEEVLKGLPVHPEFNLEDYLYNKLDFNLTEDKRLALDKYLGLLQSL